MAILSIGKRAGLSFVEMGELSVSDLFDFISIYTGADKDQPREAQQADINNFYAN